MELFYLVVFFLETGVSTILCYMEVFKGLYFYGIRPFYA